MATTTYKAKTISGAERRARSLLRDLESLKDTLTRVLERERMLIEQRRTLAKLSADGAAFFNPLVVAEAKELRDRILRDECKMNPDGTPVG